MSNTDQLPSYDSSIDQKVLAYAVEAVAVEASAPILIATAVTAVEPLTYSDPSARSIDYRRQDAIQAMHAYVIGRKGGPRADQMNAFDWFDGQGWAEQYPLHRAAMRGDVKSITTLLARHADANLKMTDWYDTEPLSWAASFNQLDCIIALIEGGADPLRPPNETGNTPLSDAYREKHTDSFALLENFIKAMPAAPKAVPKVQNKKAKAMQAMRQYIVGKPGGPRADQIKAFDWFEGQGWAGKYPLHRAAMRGDVNIITSLVGGGADANHKLTEWYDSEPLGWAASFNQIGLYYCID